MTSTNQISQDDRFVILRRALQATKELENLLTRKTWAEETAIGYLKKGALLTDKGWQQIIDSENERVIDTACEVSAKMKVSIPSKIIVEAAEKGNVAMFKALVRQGFDVNTFFIDYDDAPRNRKKKTVLAFAIKEGRDDLTEWLLKEGGSNPLNAATFEKKEKNSKKVLTENLFDYVVTGRGVDALIMANVSPHRVNHFKQNPIESFLERCGVDLQLNSPRYDRYEKSEVLNRLIALGVPTEKGLSTRNAWSSLFQGLTVYHDTPSLECSHVNDFFLCRKSELYSQAFRFFDFQKEVLTTLIENGVQWPEEMVPPSILDAVTLEKNGVRLSLETMGASYLEKWIHHRGFGDGEDSADCTFTNENLKYLIQCGLNVNKRSQKTGQMPAFVAIHNVLNDGITSENKARILAKLTDETLMPSIKEAGFTSLKSLVNRAIKQMHEPVYDHWVDQMDDFVKKEKDASKKWLEDNVLAKYSLSPRRRRRP